MANREDTFFVRLIAAVILIGFAVLLFSGCKLTDLIFGHETVATETEAGPVQDSTESTGNGADTVSPGSDTGAGTEEGTNPIGPSTEDATTGSEVTTPDPNVKLYTDPLTGLSIPTDLSKVRPVAISIDNLSSTAPQTGVGRADILAEVMVEGGISRLILITNKYSSSEVYGPVRSVRDYMVSLSSAFGTLMVGAGYSPTGYAAIKDNSLDYIDGTHDRYALYGFFRDPVRYSQTGYEHSLMISGQGIKTLATYNNFPVTVSSVVSSFKFGNPKKPVSLSGGVSTHCILTYSVFQQVQLIYSRKENAYYRYQYGTKPHLDAESGEQLHFTNVFILFADQNKIPDDPEGRLDVTLTGSGSGFYLYGGKYAEIRWSRETSLSPFSFTSPEGAVLTVNCGNSFISVVDSSLKGTDSIVLNYKVS